MAKKSYGWLGRPAWAVLDRARYQYLKDWFNALVAGWTPYDFTYHPPDKTPILDALSDPDVVAYMTNAHGDSYFAEIGTDSNTITASEVKSALENRRPMVFSFITHSEAMKDVGEGTWAYELRKGNLPGTVVVGVRNSMSYIQWFWWWKLWANAFFTWAGLGFTFRQAFERANFEHPDFLSKDGDETKDKVRFYGDVTVSKKHLV